MADKAPRFELLTVYPAITLVKAAAVMPDARGWIAILEMVRFCEETGHLDRAYLGMADPAPCASAALSAGLSWLRTNVPDETDLTAFFKARAATERLIDRLRE
jgi:hypothetical protein